MDGQRNLHKGPKNLHKFAYRNQNYSNLCKFMQIEFHPGLVLGSGALDLYLEEGPCVLRAAKIFMKFDTRDPHL